MPFYLDDFTSIIENPAVLDGSPGALWQYAPMRIIGYFSFSLNYQFGHTSPVGYHLVNILIHLLTGITVWLFARSLLRTPAMKNSASGWGMEYLPLFAALLFVAHPLQTQAVTYIVQRLASMVALFYIASMFCYVEARTASGSRKLLLYGGCILSALACLFTKQNGVTLPLALLLIELIFFPGSGKRISRFILGFLAAAFILRALLAFFYEPLSLAALDAATRETRSIPRTTYFLTQLNVLWTYIRMFFWPAGLHIEHQVALADGLHGRTLIALVGHLGVLAAAGAGVRKYPLAAFAVLFYYTAHLVESSLIPIRDVMFEHRTYLPNLGLCLLTGAVLFSLPVGRGKGRTAVILVALLLVLGSGIRTWQRNAMWRDPVVLWQDAALAAPQRSRPWNEYAKSLLEQGRHQEAIAIFHETIKRLGGENVSPGLYLEETAAVNLMMALAKEGQMEPALRIADDFITRNVKPLNRSKMLTNKGNLLFQARAFDRAEQSYREAIAAYPQNVPPLNNLGILLMSRGRLDEAEEMFTKALAIDPNFPQSRAMLARLRQKRQRQ